MIRARLIPPRAPRDLTLAVAKEQITRARSLAESRKSHTRRVIQRYSAWARHTSYQRGYEAGLEAARHDIAELLAEIKRAYDTAIDAARADILATSRDLAQQIVDTALMEHPDALMRWIEQALFILKRSRTLEIRYQPRLGEVFKRLSPRLPPQIQVVADTSLTSVDLVVQGESGGVEFSRLISSSEELHRA